MLTEPEINEVMAKMGHRLSPSEVFVVQKVCEAGAAVGYGNLIAWLNTAWAVTLMRKYAMTEDQARAGVHGTPYPLPTKVLG